MLQTVVLWAQSIDPCHRRADVPVKEALAPARLACEQVGRVHQLPAQGVPGHAPVLGSGRPAAPPRQRSPWQDDWARLPPARLPGAAVRGELSAWVSCLKAGRQTFQRLLTAIPGMRRFCIAGALRCPEGSFGPDRVASCYSPGKPFLKQPSHVNY